jgi:hypothetical protein
MLQSIASMVSFLNVIFTVSFDLKSHSTSIVSKQSLLGGYKLIVYEDEANSKQIDRRSGNASAVASVLLNALLVILTVAADKPASSVY